MATNAKKERAVAPFVPLEMETRAAVDTAAAAIHLGRKPHTLRCWACYGTHPAELKPLRINGRLAWPVAGLREVLGFGVAA